MVERLRDGDSIEFKMFKKGADGLLYIGTPVRVTVSYGVEVKVSSSSAKHVYESPQGQDIHVSNPSALDFDTQVRLGYAEKRPTTRLESWKPLTPKCPYPDEAFYKGYCSFPCALTPCPRRLGPFDPGPHNPSAPNDPRGPDPRGCIDPRGPR